jgi:glycosyltransferase involved in cell wall biosynthesis
LKVIIISEYNKFHSIGGTETYVDGLIRGLLNYGNDVVFITQGITESLISEDLSNHESTSTLKVYFLPKIKYSTKDIKGKVVSPSWNWVRDLVLEHNPEIIHIHTLSTFFNFSHIRKLVDIYYKKIFLSLHVPSHFCVQGDMIRNNKIPCNGKIGLQCVKCKFHSGIKKGVSNLFYGYHLAKLSEIVFINRNRINVICVSSWQKQQMLLNGVIPNLVSVIRQFLNNEDMMSVEEERFKYNTEKKFRVGYLGRFSIEKGSDLLMKLVKFISKNKEFEMILGCPAIGDKQMLDLLENSENVIFRNDINNNNKESFFKNLDYLIIPSYFFETGPIVLLESLHYKIPVIAPNVGGTLEYQKSFPDWVKLYDWNNFNSLKKTLLDLKNSSLIMQLCNSHPKIPDFIEATQMHLNLYSSKEEL